MTTDLDLASLTGSPAGLAELAGAATRAAGALHGARDDLARIAGALRGHRSGAVDTARELLARLTLDVVLCADVLRTVAGVLAQRATGLTSEQDAAARALTARDDALARLARAEADEVLALRADPLAPLPDAVRDAWDARVRAAQAREDVAAAERAWRDARDAKDSASRQAAPLLDGLADARAVAVSARHGVGAADHATAWARGTDLAARVPVALGGDRRARDAARTDLFAAMTAADGDPALWTAFWDAVDPASLLAVLGTDPPPGAVTALAGGLGVWAASAARDEQRDLGDRLVRGVGVGTGPADRAARLGDLLGSARLPAAVWTGAADAVVERRRATGQDDVEATDLAPLAVAVADGLSAHPRAALDHLAPGDPDGLRERLHVWFGATPPDGWPDGGVAVTGMLAAAVAVGSRADVPTQQRTALVVSVVTKVVHGYRGLLSVNAPVGGSAVGNVVDVYRPYLESVDENVHLQQDGDPRPGPGLLLTDLGDRGRVEGTSIPWSTAQPRLDPFALREVITATSATPADAGRWLSALDDHVEATVTVATERDLGPDARERLFLDTLDDVGFVSGSIQSPVIADAEQAAGLGSVAATGAGVGLSLATAFSSAGVSVAATAAGAALPGLVPDHVDAARSEVLRTEPTLRDRFAAPLNRAAVDLDVAAGASPDDAERRNEALAPGGEGATKSFGNGYALGSDLARTLGETT